MYDLNTVLVEKVWFARPDRRTKEKSRLEVIRAVAVQMEKGFYNLLTTGNILACFSDGFNFYDEKGTF